VCFSLSGGEDNLEKLAELERLLAQAQTDKLKLVEEQVHIYHMHYIAYIYIYILITCII
jgi:hypothetical protein